VKIAAASISAQKTTKEIFVKINIASDLKVHALHYANELLKNFCKLAKQTEAITNYEKQVLVMVKHCLGNFQINSKPELTVFFH